MFQGDPIRNLQAFIDDRWAVAQPAFYPGAVDRPCVPLEVTPGEAAYFLASVSPQGGELPLFIVDDERKQLSDRAPPTVKGTPRAYLFFEEPGRLRLETIVHTATVARLHLEFGWPRDYLIAESPSVTKDGEIVLTGEALDILLLETPCAELTASMTVTAARSRVGVEAKATAKQLDKLLDGMRACQASNTPHSATDHKKCLAIAELQPRLFLGVAAGDTWRLLTVSERDGRAVLGDELPDLGSLYFSSTAKPA